MRPSGAAGVAVMTLVVGCQRASSGQPAGAAALREPRVPSSGATLKINRIAAAGACTCAQDTAGSIICWGACGRKLEGPSYRGTSQLRLVAPDEKGMVVADQEAKVFRVPWSGRDSRPPPILPTPVRDFSGPFARCAVTTEDVLCFGEDTLERYQVVPPGTRSDSVVAIPGTRDAVALGVHFHACAALSDGHVVCWGENARQHLGADLPALIYPPLEVQGIRGVRRVAVGRNFSCFLDEAGVITCLGDPAADRDGPVSADSRRGSGGPVVLGRGYTEVAAGSFHLCAVRTNGHVKCWGWPEYQGTRHAGTDVEGVDRVTMLVAGLDHTCALLASGQVVCWGGVGSFECGTTESSMLPVRMTFPSAVETDGKAGLVRSTEAEVVNGNARER
jgi:alpha-tubulin suppressor-like RCC1 family protein